MDPREKRDDESWAEYGARMASMGIAPEVAAVPLAAGIRRPGGVRSRTLTPEQVAVRDANRLKVENQQLSRNIQRIAAEETPVQSRSAISAVKRGDTSLQEADDLRRKEQAAIEKHTRVGGKVVKALAPFAKVAGPVGVAYEALRSEPAVASELPPGVIPGDFRVTQAYPSMDNVYTDPTAMAYAGVMPPGEEFGSSYAGPNTMGLNRDYDRVKAMFDSPVDSASIAAPTDADVPSYETTAGDWVMNTGNPVKDALRNIAGGLQTIDWGLDAQTRQLAPQDYTVNMPTSNAALNDIMQARLSTMYGGAHHPATPTGTLGISGSVYEDPYTPGQLMWDDPNYTSSIIGRRNMLPGFELTSGVPSGSVSIDAVSPHGDMVTSTDISEFRPDLYAHHRSDPVSRIASPLAGSMDPFTTVTQGVVPFSQTLSGQTVPMSTVTKGTKYSPDFYKDISPIASSDISAQATIDDYTAARIEEDMASYPQFASTQETVQLPAAPVAAPVSAPMAPRQQAMPAAVTPAPVAAPSGPSAAEIERQKQAAVNARLAQQATARQQQQAQAAAQAQAASQAQAAQAQSQAQAYIDFASGRDRGVDERQLAAAREVLSQIDTFDSGGRMTDTQRAMTDVGYGGGFASGRGDTGATGQGGWT